MIDKTFCRGYAWQCNGEKQLE